MSQRETRFNLIIGSPRAGKSTWISEKLVKPETRNVCLVKIPQFVNDPAFPYLTQKTLTGWRQGARPHDPVKFKVAATKKQYFKEVLPWVMQSYRNGRLIVDDCTAYERNAISDGLDEILTIRAALGLDIDLVYHGLTKVPIDQFAFANNIIIFNCVDNADYKANKLPFPERLREAVQQARANYAAGLYKPVIVKMY